MQSGDQPLSPAEAALEERLKAWRRAVAKQRRVPPFFIFGDQVLRSIARTRPTTLNGLGAVSGVGPSKLENFGAAVCAICAGRE